MTGSLWRASSWLLGNRANAASVGANTVILAASRPGLGEVEVVGWGKVYMGMVKGRERQGIWA